MQKRRVGSVSGHVFRVERAKGPQWYAKYRRGDGRQIKERIAPAGTRRGRPADGFYNQRTAEAWLRHGASERGCKPSTMRDHRNAVRNLPCPVFGERRLVDITRWRASPSALFRSSSAGLIASMPIPPTVGGIGLPLSPIAPRFAVAARSRPPTPPVTTSWSWWVRVVGNGQGEVSAAG